jgi:hypothetical protein
MKRTTKTLIAAAAVSGLLGGAVVTRAHSADQPPSPGKSAPTKAPKVQGCAGQNDCKGIGGCKTKEHDCKFKNDCKGKGGCEISKEDIKKWEQAQKAKKS